MREEILLTVSEIAVAFAGFSGLVVALNRRETSPDQRQLQFGLLTNVLATSLIAVAFSLLPPVLLQMNGSPDVAWRVSSAVFAVTLCVYMSYLIPTSWALFRAANRSVPWTFQVNAFIGALVILLNLLCAAGIVPTSVYLAGPVFSLYTAGSSFVRVFLSIARDSPAV